MDKESGQVNAVTGRKEFQAGSHRVSPVLCQFRLVWSTNSLCFNSLLTLTAWRRYCSQLKTNINKIIIKACSRLSTACG